MLLTWWLFFGPLNTRMVMRCRPSIDWRFTLDYCPAPKPPRFHLVLVGTRGSRHYTGSMFFNALPAFTARSKRASSGEQAAATVHLPLRARMDEPVSKRGDCALKRKHCGARPHQAPIKQPPSRMQAHAPPQPPSAAQAALYELHAFACATLKPARISAACA